MQVIIDGKNINYEVEGSGNPVVLLHGWLCSTKTMEPLAKYLSKYFKVYNIDIIGFGKSDLPDKPMNTDDYGNFLDKFIKELNIENPILIGHSHGGRTIINYAGRHLGNMNKIVLIDSAGIVPKRSIKYYIKIYTFKTLRKMFELLPKTEMFLNIKKRTIEKLGSADYKNSPEVLRKSMNLVLNEDQKNNLSNINVPTLLIWGDKDTATPIEQAKIMEKLIKGSGLIVFEGAGHYSYLEKLPNTLTILDDFLKEDIKKGE